MSNPKCPKCGSENVTSERRPDGNSRCQDCKHQDKLAAFYIKELVEQMSGANNSLFERMEI